MIELMPHQLEVLDKLGNGKILYGGVGWGKSATALGYYMKYEAPKHCYVITTAKKRDTLDWQRDGAQFGLGEYEDGTVAGILTVDSWNKLDMYTDVEDAFFIFDEQRLVGYGAWTKSFLKVAKKNRWILLTATPGDTWLDYAPVFIANGFYRNMTDFKRKHVLYEPFIRFPKVRGYIGEQKLEILRNEMLVEMTYKKHTERYVNYLDVSYDKKWFKQIYDERWNPYSNEPVKDVSEMWRLLRRVVNSDPSRLDQIIELMKIHDRLIIFYNFNYELDILRTLAAYRDVFECNGHRKDELPDGGKWVYLVQYVAGSEGWNCTSTDAMVLYSLTYSYKNFEQAQGRIDRLNTLYTSLYYYVLVAKCVIDLAIRKSLDQKQNFNENRFIMELDKFGEVSSEILEKLQI